MAKKLSSVVGIDIGSQKIKIAELRSKGREPEITALGIIDTPEGAVDQSGVYNGEVVGAALKQLLSQSGASVGQAIVSISGQASVLVRTLEVPRMNPTELKEHMQWEINRNIPFADSNVVSDYRALSDDDPNSPNMDVVMAIAPQSAIDTLVACMKKAGRALVAIDVEPLSIARSLQASYDEYTDMVVCYVDIGHKTTSINIYRNGKLLMPRQIPVGGEQFTKAIADALAVSTEEAEVLKTERLHIPDSAIQAAASPLLGGGFMDVTPGATQEFQPYNPFGDADPNPFMEPSPAPNPFADQPTPNPFEDAPPNPFADNPAPDVYADLPPPNPFADEPASGAGSYDPYGGAPLPGEPVDPFAMADAPMTNPADASALAIDDPELARLFAAISPILEDFVGEVRRSIDYFKSRGGDIHRVLLGGGGSKIVGLPAYLSASVGLECDAYNPMKRLNINSKRIGPDYAEEHAQEFSIAVGNGLHIFYD